MKRIISQKEFEFRAINGCTQEEFVFGLGHVQWIPTMMTSYAPSKGGSLYSRDSLGVAKYHQVKYEMQITNSDEYRQALANEIKETITDGKLIWDPLSGEVRRLSTNSSVDVVVDTNNMVTTTVRERNKVLQTQVYVSDLISAIQQQNFNRIGNINFTGINGEMAGIAWDNLDYVEIARKSRSFSSTLMLIQRPFQMVQDKLYLYSKTLPKGTHLFEPLAFFNKFIPNGHHHLWGLTRFRVELSNTTIVRASQILKHSGRMIGGVGIFITGVDIVVNGLNPENGTHLIMATLVFTPLAPISTAYFISDMVLYYFTGKGVVKTLQEDVFNTDSFRRNFIDSSPTMPENYELIEIMSHKNNLA